MAQVEIQPAGIERGSKARRLEAAAWGLFFMMLGGILLLPSAVVPQGTWLVGAGLIMLGLNAVRSLYGIRTSPFTVGLGVVAVVAGLVEIAGMALPVFPLILILIGIEIVFSAVRSPDHQHAP